MFVQQYKKKSLDSEQHLLINNNGYGTMPQAGINPPAQSHASYEASSLPPSHHGWITLYIIWGFFFKS